MAGTRVDIKKHAQSRRAIWAPSLPRPPSRPDNPEQTFGWDRCVLTRLMRSLYAAVRDVSGCAVIVDSTKDRALRLPPPRSVQNWTLRIVHLVRDSREVAYSWEKTEVARPEYGQPPDTGAGRSWTAAPQGDRRWNGTPENVLFHYLGRSGVPRLLMRYESLLDDPTVGLQRVLSLVLWTYSTFLLLSRSDPSAGRIRIVAAPYSRRQPDPFPTRTRAPSRR